MKLTTEQRPTFSQAAQFYATASGMPAAAAVEKLHAEPGLLGVIATGLREIAGGTSPLADEIDALIPSPIVPEVEPTP